MQTSVTMILEQINTTSKQVSNQMSRWTICTDIHVLCNLSHKTEKLATNVTLLNSSHKEPEQQSGLKHLAQNQRHYETDLNGELKGG